MEDSPLIYSFKKKTKCNALGACHASHNGSASPTEDFFAIPLPEAKPAHSLLYLIR